MVKVSSVCILCIANAFAYRISAFTVSCDIPSVEEGKTAVLNCHFEDMMQDRSEIFVYHQRRNASGPPDTLLNCFWDNTAGNYNCPVNLHSVTPGKLETGSLTLNITNAGKENEGKYTCYKEGLATEQALGCYFSLSEAEKSDPTEPTSSQQPTSGTKGRSTKGPDHTTVIVGVTVPVLLLLTVVVIIVFVRRRSKRHVAE